MKLIMVGVCSLKGYKSYTLTFIYSNVHDLQPLIESGKIAYKNKDTAKNSLHHKWMVNNVETFRFLANA